MKSALALAFVLSAGASFADVKGTFHFGKTTFQPVDAVAYQVPGPDGKPLTIIAVSDFKIDRQAVTDAINPVQAFLDHINAEQKGNFVMVRLTSADHCGIYGFVGNGMQQIDLGDKFNSKASVGASRVAGQCSTSTAGKMFDDAYDFNLTYDVPLIVIPKPSQLAAGGGEPGQAYVALVKAIRAADWNAAHLGLRKDEVPETPPKAADMKRYFEGVGLNYPRTVTVTGGLIKGNRADIEIKGTNRDNAKIHGTVMMIKSAGHWRVIDQNFYNEQ